jgi:hypothetical protein
MNWVDESLKGKEIYVILGFARSGTSAIAKALNVLGVDLGTHFTDPSNKWNKKGFFEDKDVVYNINANVFAALNEPQYSIRLLETEKLQALPDVAQKAQALLKKRFAVATHWGFKDPSTAKILSFWQSVFAELKLSERYLIALRNPLASATSYSELTGTDHTVSVLLWLMHMYAAVSGTQGKKRVVVSYEQLLSQPRVQLDRIYTQLDMTTAKSRDEVERYVEHFLDTTLNRYHSNEDTLFKHPVFQTVPLCQELYTLLKKEAQDEISSELFFKEWEEIKFELEAQYPMFCFMDAILRQNKQLLKKEQILQKSFAWKLFTPFRLVSDALSAKRRQKRAKRRLIKAY